MEFIDLLTSMSDLPVDWQNASPSEIRQLVAANLQDELFLRGLNGDEVDAVVLLVSSWAKENDDAMAWLELRKNNRHEAADEVKAMLKIARHDITLDFREARKAVNKMTRSVRSGQRILAGYRQAMNEKKAIDKEVTAQQNVILMAGQVIPAIQQEIATLESDLGASKPFYLNDGTTIPVPPTPNSTQREIEESMNNPETKQVYNRFGEHKTTDGQAAQWMFAIQEWLRVNRASGGAMVKTMETALFELGTTNMQEPQRSIRQSMLMKTFSSLAASFENTGTLAGMRLGAMLRNYSFKVDSNDDILSSYGTKVSRAKSAVMKAMKIANDESFYKAIHNTIFGYIEKRRDLQELPTSEQRRDAILTAVH